LAGILVNLVAGGIGVCVMYRWVVDRCGVATARAAVVTLLVYPYTLYFYGVVYAEPVFFAAAVGAFLLLERDHVVAAGLVGAIASGTRLVGVAVAIALVIRLLERRGAIAEERHLGITRGRSAELGSWRDRLHRLRPSDAGVLLAFGGAIAYSVYLWIDYGDPLLFQEAGKAWGQGEGLRTLLKARTFQFLTNELPYLRVELVLQVLLLLGAVVLAGPVSRRFGRAYGWYVVLVLGIPLVTVGNLFGAGRYVLAAFPVFVVVGEWFRQRPEPARLVAVAGVTVTVISLSLYVRGLWVS